MAFDDFLKLEGKPSDFRVVVAMSGGVDSSVAACMMKEAGYDVVGITLQLYDYGAVVQKKGACCAGQDIYDAAQVAEKINIPHYVFNYEDKFKESVMDDFADTYLKGSTPVPCIRCNQSVKFRDLLKAAKSLDAKALVTGHYVQWVHHKKAELHRGMDSKRDQSYFLFTTTQEQLDFLRFPLGVQSKDETRETARRFDLKVSEKPDSMDICFVPNGDYKSVVEKLRPGALDPGNIVDLKGQILGTHEGIIGFTVGQRKGLQIGGHLDPLYVVKLNAETKEVIVGPKEALAKKTIRLSEVNWLGEHKADRAVGLKYRSYHDPIQGFVTFLDNNTAEVEFDEAQYGVSPGQACVFYDNTRLLGGGWIIS